MARAMATLCVCQKHILLRGTVQCPQTVSVGRFTRETHFYECYFCVSAEVNIFWWISFAYNARTQAIYLNTFASASLLPNEIHIYKWIELKTWPRIRFIAWWNLSAATMSGFQFPFPTQRPTPDSLATNAKLLLANEILNCNCQARLSLDLDRKVKKMRNAGISNFF